WLPPSAPVSRGDVGSGRRGARDCDFVKGQAGLGMNGVLARERLPAFDRDIDEARLELQRIGPPPDPLRRQNGRSRPAEGVEHDVAASGAVLDRIGDERDRLDGRVGLELVETPCAERIDAGVMPDVRPRSAVAPQFNVVEMGPIAYTEHTNELVLAA